MGEDVLETSTGQRFHTRAMAPQDLPAVLSLEQSVQPFPWRRASFEDYLNHPRGCCQLAFDGPTLAGFVVVTHGGGDAELLNIAVAPECQRRGLGSALLQWTRDRMRPHADLLFLEVRVSNRKAIEFYYRQGFFETGRRAGYYPAASGREDALLLACQLNS